jgi:putative oxidoreductase
MKQKITFVICLLFGLMFINAGLNKLLNYIPTPDDLPEAMVKMASAMAEISWLFPLIGIVEIVGGVLFIVPRLRALGAVIIFPILIGIVLTHITVAPSGLPVALILLLINLLVMYQNREKYAPMVRK